MGIVCGVDSSASSREAARAAAALAKRCGDALLLVYVQDAFMTTLVAGEAGVRAPLASQELLDLDRRLMQTELDGLVAELARAFEIEVSLRIEMGFPERELARCAQELGASFLVVGALGRRKGSMWRLGSIADRLSQFAPVPVLIVREAESLVRWGTDGNELRVLLALGDGSPTARALRTVSELARLGPCAVIEAHAYDPRREAQRLGLADAESPEARRAIESTLARELPQRFVEEPRREAGRFVTLPARGSVAETLVEFAESERADLIVSGARGRGALQRRFLGSVSYGLVGLSTGNVLVAHAPELVPETRAARKPASVRRVLVATDLSESGNRGVDFALGLLPEGGQLTLLHVLPALVAGPIPPLTGVRRQNPEERRMNRSLAEAELRKLLPTQGRALEVVVEALESDDVPAAILQAAQRHGVDLVILGRHGHGWLNPAWIGSIARAVARRSPQPVLLVPESPRGS